MLAVGRTDELARRGTCRVGKAFELKGGYNVLRLAVGVFIELFHADGVEAGCNNYRAVLFFDEFVFLGVVNSACGTNLGANTAFAVFEHITVIRVDSSNLRYCLSERNVNCALGVHIEVEVVGYLLHRTFFGTSTATRAKLFLDVTSLFLDLNVEIADESRNLRNFAVRENADFFVLSNVNHFRR